MINHISHPRTRQVWIVLAAAFLLAGVVNIGLAVSEDTLWPAILAATVLVAAAGCVRGAVTR
jgi:uncharacterized membrane protein